MEESILITIKKLLGLSENNESFDLDVITHINTVFMTLRQIGVGPEEGFSIEDDGAIWEDYVSPDDDLEAIKTYIFLRVKIIFDPPLNAAVLEALQENMREYEWRLNSRVDYE